MSLRPRHPLPTLLLSVSLVGLLAGPAIAQDETPPDAPATALRVSLDRLLAEHAFLSLEVVRSGIAGNPDFTAAAAVLEDNTTEIVAAIESVYGAEAAEAFGEHWRNHIGFLVDYARALVDGDADAAQLASEQLDRYVADFSGFLAEAIPALPQEAVEGLIEEHVQQLEHVSEFELSAFGDAYPAIRDTYRHMFTVGDGLAVGIVSLFPERFEGQEAAFSPATDLRITLDRLFGEHTYLAALAMRAALTDAPDAESAANALAENSAELQDTIAEVYGAEAGEAFGALWESHVDSYFAYVTGLATDDDAVSEGAVEDLGEYQTDFSAFVADANPFVPAEVLEALIATHTDHLITQADAYAAGDYELAFEIARDAYVHTAELSASLAAAISDQFPQRFPDAAMAPDRGSPWPLVGATLVVLGAVVVALRSLAVSVSRRARPWSA
ncbi:MAG: hypothetical protein ACRDGV_00625 [Candidatus Limnocylindria bacterium]